MNSIATFGAGCFWHTEEDFRGLKGVIDTAVGFMGGTVPDPSYEDVCSDTTEHVEVAEIKYDPETISYEELLKQFFQIHDPTQKDGQGVDIGSQYRSVIFYHDLVQKEQAESFIKKLNNSGKYGKQIVTRVEPATTFYKAEEYHQKYLAKRGLSSCPL